MALHGNISRNTLGTFRVWGGTTDTITGNRGKYWSWANWIRQAQAASGLSYAAKPTGDYAPATYYQPIQAGEMHCGSFSGSGFISYGNLAGGLNAQATLTGSGDVTQALLGLIVSLSAALTGSGDITALSSAAAVCTAALSGSGDLLVTALQGLGLMLANLTGTASVTGALQALGELEAAINVTGDLLTTANVADLVWEFLIETGLSAQDAVRLMSAALAGELSGAATSTIQIKNAVAGDKTRITATVDGSGNRTDISVDLSD